MTIHPPTLRVKRHAEAATRNALPYSERMPELPVVEASRFVLPGCCQVGL
jgi:hypothetical protein